MRALAAVLALGWAAGARAQAADPDPWLGQDKALHFAASAGIAGTGYGLAGLWQPPPDEVHRLAIGGSAGLAAGVAKELLDLAGLGMPSWRDLAWDVAGTAFGLALAWAVDRLVLRPLLLRPAGPAGTLQRSGDTAWSLALSACW